MRDDNVIKRDRLRYTKNKTSSNLVILAIVFNVLYFISIYSSNIGTYYYNFSMGLSVIYNLLFMLFSFLCMEGLKNYSYKYSAFIIAIGLLQIPRIFYIPWNAHNSTVEIGEVETIVMQDKQFIYVVVLLALSCATAVASGVIGIYKTAILNAHVKSLEQSK